MPTRRVLMGIVLAGVLAGASAGPARAVEYRLEVVNLWENALYAYASAAPPAASGLQR